LKKFLKTFVIVTAVILSFIFCFALTGCTDDEKETETKPCENHTWTLISSTATCIDAGIATYKCSVCNNEKTEAVNATLQHSFTNDVCSMCHSPKQPITISDVKWTKPSTSWVSIQGNGKNISQINIRKIKLYCYLLNSNNEIIAQDDTYLTNTEYIQSNSTLGFSILVRNVNLEWVKFTIRVEVPTFEPYTITYNK